MRVLIVGGGYAGAATALRLARRVRKLRRTVEIILANPTETFVERIRRHQAAAGQMLRKRSLRALLEPAGVRLVTGFVTWIDPRARTAEVGGRLVRWDRLVFALGSRPGTADVPGAEAHALRLEAPGAATFAARVPALPTGARVAIVGTGLTGVEAAAEIKEARPDLAVALLGRGAVGERWSEAGRSHLLQTFARLGVDLHEGVRVDEVRAGRLVTSSGDLAADALVWAAGFEMSSLPWDSGVPVNGVGQVKVDPQLRSVAFPEIYAAGDIAAPVLAPGLPLPMGCKSALPTGAHVGDNLAREAAGLEPLPFDFRTPFFCVSLGRRDGLIQWSEADGSLTGRTLTGRPAAWFKELICKSTWWALVWEARGLNGIAWMRTGSAPDRLPERGIEVLHA